MMCHLLSEILKIKNEEMENHLEHAT